MVQVAAFQKEQQNWDFRIRGLIFDVPTAVNLPCFEYIQHRLASQSASRSISILAKKGSPMPPKMKK
jgi:hypothetical protein